MIGQTIDDKYEIRQLIGEGAMGAVYEARHTETDRRVALKLITHEAAGDDELLRRLEEDTKEAAKLITPHVVEVLDEGKAPDSGHPYVVTELLRGENVRALLERLDHLLPEVAARLVGQVCLGLEKAHAAGLPHRDLKPANLFLVRAEDGARSIKLLDFGVGRMKMDHALTTGNESLVRGLSVLGSPLYMSPEQAGARDDLDHRSDIWSLGIVLYELLVGAPPHKQAKSLEELKEAIEQHDPPPVRERAEWVAPELAEIVHRAIQRDPAERFPSAEAMREALEAYVPSGWGIVEDDLVPMTDEQRSPWSPEEDTRRVRLEMAKADEDEEEGREPGDETEAGEDEPEEDAERERDEANDEDQAESDTTSKGDDESPLASPEPDGDGEEGEQEATPADEEHDEAAAEKGDAAASPDAKAPSREGTPGGRGSMAVVVGVVVGVLAIVGYLLVGTGDGPPRPSGESRVAPSTEIDTRSAAAGEGGNASAEETASAGETVEPADGGAEAGLADGGGGFDAGEAVAATGRLKISPPFAAVAVDGQRAPVKAGYVEISGDEGSVHAVVVTVAGKTKTVRVTLTADGPDPPHVIFMPSVGARPKAAGDDDLYE